MSIDATVLSQLREHYAANVTKLIYESAKETNPLFAMAESKKIRDGFGRKFIVPYVLNAGAAASADASVADSINGDGSAGGLPDRGRFECFAVNYESVFYIQRDEIVAAEGKPDDQFDVISEQMDAAAIRLRNRIAEKATGNGWGALGLTTAQTSTTFTVSSAVAAMLKLGDRLQASISEDTDVLANSAAVLRVTAINQSSGVITTSANPQTSWANNAALYIFRQGDHIATDPNSAEASKLCISGLSAHVDPVNASTLWGVTRTGNPDLTGHLVDCTGMDTITSLASIAERLFYNGRPASHVLVSPTTWKLLQVEKDAVKHIDVKLGDYGIGFRGLMIPTAFGDCTVLPQLGVAPGEAYAGPFDSKDHGPKLFHSGKDLVNLDDFDGKQMERITTNGARAYKGSFFFRGNFVIQAPGAYCKGTNLPTS